jgi:hypothetical protein
MAGLYEIEVEPEVRSWLASLPDRDFGRVDFLVGLLAEHAEDLGEPYPRHLGGEGQGIAVPPAAPADQSQLMARAATAGDLIDGVPQDPQRRGRRSSQGTASARNL